MAAFEPAIELVLKHEGGYTAGLPDDPGGETNFGISKRAFPELDIKNLTREQAIDVYKENYWKRYMEVQEDQRVANCFLDCAVNQGPSAASNINFILTSAEGGGRVLLKDLQLKRLLRYVAQGKPQFYKSWFSRTLDV